MDRVRLIARLDIKGDNLIKPIRFDGLRVLGRPEAFASNYYENGADEIIVNDSVASLYQRETSVETLRRVSDSVYIPVTACGGIKSMADIERCFASGADKVAINTGIIHRKELIREAAKRFGSQAVIASIDAKRTSDNRWECYMDCGREKSGLDAVKWAAMVEDLGAGEILLTSVDREGTRIGFEKALVNEIIERVSIPVIVSGGAGELAHIEELLDSVRPSGMAFASILHYHMNTIEEIKELFYRN